MKEKLNKIKFPLLAFILPILVMLFFFVTLCRADIETISYADMQYQYTDLLLFFKRIVLGQDGIFYSFINGMGGNVYSSMSYYMLSPVNFIMLLFKTENIMYAVGLMLLIKIGLCGLNMYYLLNYKNDKNKVFSLTLSLCYALMAFIINHWHCILWTDVLYLAPLVVIGIDKLINEKKVLMYMITLSLCVLINFYMGYMVCIFSAIYFTYSIIIKYKWKQKKKIFETILRFFLASLLAGLSVAVIYIPTIISIWNSDRMVIESDSTTIQGFIYRMFISSYARKEDILSFYYPCLYCGIIVLVACLTYILNNKVNKKERIATLVVFLIFVLSVLIPKLSYVWHGFSFPIGYNYRFTFLFCLFAIMISHKQLCKANKPKNIYLYIGILAILALIFTIYDYNNIFGYATVAAIIIYGIIIFINKKFIQYIILLLVLFELTFSGYTSIQKEVYHYQSRKDFYNDICLNIPDSSGYRVSGYQYYSQDENIMCGFSGTDIFSTTINSKISQFYSKIGSESGINMYDDNGYNTPVIYSILGVKYLYTEITNEEYNLIKTIEVKMENDFQNVHGSKTNFIYENPYVLNIGYMIDNYKPINAGTAFDYQNELLKNFSGINEDALVFIEEKNDAKILESKNLYFLFHRGVDRIEFGESSHEYIRSGLAVNYPNTLKTTDFKLITYSEDPSPINYSAFYLDKEVLKKSIDKIRESQLENVVIDKNIITGTIDAKKEGMLALSIPYEDGFKIYVDGEEKDIEVIYDFFMGVKLDEGKHDIKLVYKPVAFNKSLVISIVFIILSVLYIIYNDTKKFNNIKKNVKKCLKNITKKHNK